MEEERDLVTFSDDDGNEFDLEVIDYFEHEGQEYAVLVDAEPDEEEAEDTELEVYIMKIVVNGEYEEFLPADEDKMDELIKIVEARMAEDDGCDCGCEHDDCDCEHEGCDCGCHDHE